MTEWARFVSSAGSTASSINRPAAITESPAAAGGVNEPTEWLAVVLAEDLARAAGFSPSDTEPVTELDARW
jgi:hypothetical protein